ncbi:MAG: hypothetical protein ACD_80C00012G0014 [uncultured bacterium (gcode 4)]|uniref:Uncharacterized protein n=1 Tax=uncultured bacterium (gcode 4) TaxID=1234023 RepID=K1XZ55_9BACT|nr:MAG: hypothetical protein ACD_80C00012G0014 [uncultured bacterium (gcode 4)]
MNFKKNVVPAPKKPSFTGYTNDYMVQQPKKSISLLTLFVVIICTFFVAFLLFKNFDRMTNRLSSSIEADTGFQIGQSVSLSGILQANGDLISYTHTLTLSDTTVIGLKSRTLDLSIYTGQINIQWTIEKELNTLYILEVNIVSWTLASTWVSGNTWTEALLWSGSGIYIAQAGIYLPAEFGTKYIVLNQWENGVLKVKNIVTDQVISISYFACKKSDPNKNCSQLLQNIWPSAEKTVSTSYANKLYKLEWVTSWFFTNGDFYGYFINDIPEQEVIDVANAFVLPNETYVNDNLLSKIQTLCTDGNTSLLQVTTHALGMDLNGLIINLQGPTADGTATCKVFIDPSQAAGGTKLSYISNTPTVSGETGTITTSPTPTTPSTSNIDTSVKQFPINLEKTMTFTSNRGYSVIFPSMNIAYESLSADEDLGLPGVRCSTQMNVTKFSDKATLSDDPKVRIFSCTIKGTLSDIWNSILSKTSANGIQFLIQILDPSWAEFAANIQIN